MPERLSKALDPQGVNAHIRRLMGCKLGDNLAGYGRQRNALHTVAVDMMRLSQAQGLPIQGSPTGEQGRKPHQILTASVLVMTGTTGKKSEKRAVAALRALQ